MEMGLVSEVRVPLRAREAFWKESTVVPSPEVDKLVDRMQSSSGLFEGWVCTAEWHGDLRKLVIRRRLSWASTHWSLESFPGSWVLTLSTPARHRRPDRYISSQNPEQKE